MHSFAVIAGFAAAANAAAYGYTAQNTTSEAAYAVSSSAAAYPVYSVSSAAYAVSSAAAYPVYSTTVVKGLSTVCSEATTLKVGSKTYVVTKPTTIIDNDCEYTTTVPVKATPTPAKGTPVVYTPVSVKASSTPVGYSAPVVVPGVSSKVIVPYPSSNGTATYAVATGATPSSTKASASQFTGAAAQTGAAMLAIVGAVAAFL